MPAIFNVADFLKIGIFAMIFLFLANKALKAAGMERFAI